jgi:hypothetical protein
MALQVSNYTVVDNNRTLTNITGVDATTAAAFGSAGVGGTSVQTSSSASPTFNAGSNNVFIHTGLGASSSVTFSSLPTNKEWIYLFNTGFNGNAFDITKVKNEGIENWLTVNVSTVSVYDSFLSYGDFNASGTYKTLMTNAFGSTINYVHAMNFNEDGTKFLIHQMYAPGGANKLAEFSCSTAYDLNTASFIRSVNPYWQSTIANYYSAPHINQYGKGILYCGEGVTNRPSANHIMWQPMSTAWDTSTLGTQQSFNVGRSTFQCSMSANGQYIFYVDGSSNTYRRTLSTPYNLSTAGSETLMNLPSGVGSNIGYNGALVFFSADGKQVSWRSSSQTYFVGLTTAFDLTSADASTSRYLTRNSSGQPYYGISAGGVMLIRNSYHQHLVYDLRAGYTPVLSQVPNAFSNLPPDSWIRADLFTNNGGTNIYVINNTAKEG